MRLASGRSETTACPAGDAVRRARRRSPRPAPAAGALQRPPVERDLRLGECRLLGGDVPLGGVDLLGTGGQLGHLELALDRLRRCACRRVAPRLGVVDDRLGDDALLAEDELALVVVLGEVEVGARLAELRRDHADLLRPLAGAEIGELRLRLGEPRLGAGDRLVLVGIVEARRGRRPAATVAPAVAGRSTMRPACSAET